MSYRFVKDVASHGLVATATIVAMCWGLDPALAQPPEPPMACKLFGTDARCGLVGFNCDTFSAADEIVIAGFGVRVTSVVPRIGMINGEYFSEGRATVRVCARREGTTRCGSDAIDVTFGPIVCSGGGSGSGNGPPCRPSDPECHPTLERQQIERVQQQYKP